LAGRRKLTRRLLNLRLHRGHLLLDLLDTLHYIKWLTARTTRRLLDLGLHKLTAEITNRNHITYLS
jgi:hypothetical protein